MSNRENHFKLWNRIAETGEDKETAYKDLFDFETMNECFACEEADARWQEANSTRRHLIVRSERCYYCPINWGAPDCESGNSPYLDYILARGRLNADLIKEAADAILDLEWIPEEDMEDIEDE